MKTVAAIFLFATAALAADPYIPSDIERARWTMQDMRSWMIVFEAYKTDHSEYPHVATPEDARAIGEPIYIRVAPMTDAWGHQYRIEADGKSFRIVSAGADGVFQTDVSQNGTLTSFNDDAVATNEGKWLVRTWALVPQTDAERAKTTLTEIRVIRTAVEGYARVHNAYPAAKNMEELRSAVQPDFIKILPMRDAWGNAFIYELDDKAGYRVISAGADGKFDRTTWSVGGIRTSFDDDAVALGDRAGWFRYWEIK